jgi:hypothetical protein
LNNIKSDSYRYDTNEFDANGGTRDSIDSTVFSAQLLCNDSDSCEEMILHKQLLQWGDDLHEHLLNTTGR